ncbi:ABC transporter ATP-binding protein [Marinobacter sp. M216]|uniref:ABC transporter ATP-binding protein n=1 Tax=Marinobacter albus TaxID=3030833 RepID=A0ABT7HAA2_9GAMM|nr:MULTISPECIES: ABC transporter ATP-binding protein [unclassified Marinobacter]MBW7471273.1 ABC transporter ATP-binding protein [Marinobacter sp. F4218]MDK9556450.1 ABC transporter ATP-binding protein [Marinobacter sp. M216]
MTEILKTVGLSRYFGAVTAAEDINVTITEGEIVGVIGANGAGKTTFINMVTGYLPPSSGTIEFGGKPIKGLGPRKLMRKGLTRSFQIPQLFLELPVIDNLAIALAAADHQQFQMIRPVHTKDRLEAAEEILAQMNIAQYRNEMVTAMPQGARKLLDIAIAMLGSPRMLLLDEPTSGVSVEEKYTLMDTVMEAVRQRGLTVLFVEHDMEIVQRYVTRVLAFASGIVIKDGPVDEVLADEKVQELVTGKPKTAKTEGGA